MPEMPADAPAPALRITEHLYVPHYPGSVTRARRWARQLVVHTWGVSAEVADDVEVVVSELAGNVLKHVPRVVRGCVREFHVFLELLAPHTVRVEVHDAADGQVHVTSADFDDEGGRGLLLVQALAKEWAVCTREPFGKVVWAVVGPAASG